MIFVVNADRGQQLDNLLPLGTVTATESWSDGRNTLITDDSLLRSHHSSRSLGDEFIEKGLARDVCSKQLFSRDIHANRALKHPRTECAKNIFKV